MKKHKTLFIAITVFIINFSIGAGFFFVNEQNYQTEQRANAVTVVNERAYALERQLDRSLSSTYALASIIRQEGKINNFDALAADMIESYGGISSLQLAPNAIVSQIYPIEGNEAAIGHDLLNDPNRHTETLAAIESGKLTLAGPFELVQGGIAVIGRYPVFLVEDSGESNYWGFTIALIQLDELLEASGFDRVNHGEYAYEIWRTLPDSGEIQVFYQTSTIPLSSPVDIDIEIPNGTWILSIAPQGGWNTSPVFFIGIGLTAFASLLVSLFIYNILQQPETLRKLAKESENKFKSITTQSNEGITVADLDGNYIFVNPAFCEMMGYSEKELLQMTVFDMRGKSQSSVFEKSTTTQESVPLSVILRRKNGTEYTAEVTGKLIDFHGKQSALGIVRDITRRKLAEETLETQSNSLANIIQGTNAGTWDWNIQTGEEIINERWAEIIGWTMEELTPVNIETWRKSVHPDDISPSNTALEKHVNGELEYYDVEFRQRHKNGEWIWINARGKIIEWTEDGKPLRMSGTHIDINERKMAEQNILLLNKELEQRVLMRTAELSATIQEIESFSYSVSHDLRAPLRAISGFSEILISDYAESLDGDIKEYLNKMHKASKNMDDLITGMLFLSRLSRERLSLIPFRPDQMATQVFETLSQTEPQQDISFNAHPCPEIVADPNLIKILLTNLISNAIKFTQEEKSGIIEFSSIVEKDSTVFYLRDNGIGFNMAYVDKLFIPFQRLHSGDQFQGTGIGLAISHRVIQRHKGKIWVESEEGVGTTIYFTIGSVIDKK